MKYLILLAFFSFSISTLAQAPCDYSYQVNDSVENIKATKEYLVSEKIFGNTSKYIFFSLVNTEGIPVLSVQNLQKSKDFILANCLDRNSKIYFQLSNGKIYTLIHSEEENCGNYLRDGDNQNNLRVTTATFLFMKNDFEDLKKYPITLMRIKYATETVDYIIKKELDSELTKTKTEPEKYFMNYLKCVM
ncbi:hypothetical protein [Flavobacterium sp. '19STA2R22 D10 B1']|uniref:hypothetical protein n=1 Tax=Flavobacterium aerium TaxID=3037261 RepID=UPI00278C169A|nr:hypothetical protein [Flavobacterium sp. '19STA2R22 D10 B1']